MISLVSWMSSGHRGGVRAPSIAGTFVVLALIIGGIAAGARAELQTWTFGGTVTQINYIPGVPPSTWSEVQVGDPWSLSFTFDTDGADQVPGDPRFGHYLIDSFALAIGPAMTSIAEVPPGIFVQPPGHFAFGGIFNVFPDVQNFVDVGIDSETEIFSSDAMPTTIDLNDFSVRSFEFNHDVMSTGENLGIFGTVDTFIPVPGTLGMLAFGLLAASRRRRVASTFAT